MAPLLKKIGVQDQALNVVQGFTAQAVNPLLQRPWVADSILLQDVALGWDRQNNIAHKLGRTIQGWEIVRRIPRPGGYDEKFHQVDTAGEPVFQNGWGENEAPARVTGFQMMPDGHTNISGIITGGSISTADPVFVLPLGFRFTSGTIKVPTAQGGAFGRVIILSDGRVCAANAGANTNWSLDGIRFAATNPWHAGAHVWDLNSDTTIDIRMRENFLLLRATANCTVDLVVW